MEKIMTISVRYHIIIAFFNVLLNKYHITIIFINIVICGYFDYLKFIDNKDSLK